MLRHRGLPANLPKSLKKGRIFCVALSPSKQTSSPCHSTDNHQRSVNQSSQKSSSQGKSRHQILLKQKPLLSPTTKSNSEIKKNFQETQKENTSFVNEVLGLMKPILQKKNKNSERNLNRNEKVQNSNVSEPVSAFPDYHDQQLLNRCIQNMTDINNFSSYVGQKEGHKRNGYGIQYFRNSDKFMGGFMNNQAQGHGTYYFMNQKLRLMSVWKKNQIVLKSGYIIQRIE